MKKIVKGILICLLSLVLFAGNQLTANATQLIPVSPMIYIEKYEITNERIIPGESFTLIITIKNHSDYMDAHDVKVDIDNPGGVAPVYGTVSQMYVGELKAGEEKTISFEYDSWTSIKTDTIDFYVMVQSDIGVNNVTLRVPSSADIPFSLLEAVIPSEAYAGEYSSASLTFKVLGEESVSDVVLLIECNGVTIGTSQAGSIIAGTTKTQSATFLMYEKGTVKIDIMLEYVTSEGIKNKVQLGSRDVTIKEKQTQPIVEEQQQVEEQKDMTNEMLILGISGVLVLILFMLVVIIIRKRR